MPHGICIAMPTQEGLDLDVKDTPEAAAAMFMGRGGLAGVPKEGWYEPILAVGDEHYTWEHLGSLLLMLGGDLAVTIKVDNRKVSGSSRARNPGPRPRQAEDCEKQASPSGQRI